MLNIQLVCVREEEGEALVSYKIVDSIFTSLDLLVGSSTPPEQPHGLGED
jgi:hypothetical protein